MLSFLSGLLSALGSAFEALTSWWLIRAGQDRQARKQSEAENEARRTQQKVAADVSGLTTDELADRVRREGF